MKRKILMILLVFISAFCFALGLSACGGSTNNSAGTNNSGNTNSGSNGGGNEQSSNVAVTGVSLNKTVLSLEVGDSETLIATVSPSNATNKTVTWESSNTTIAIVSNGKVTAIKVGTAKITASAGNKSATCAVTVNENAITHTHELTRVPAKDADCEVAGNTAYYTCTCDKWFSDADAKNEITDKTSVIVKATGHSFSSEWTTSCTQHWHAATCKHTDLKDAAENHNFDNSVCKVCEYEKGFLIFNTLEVNDVTVYGKVSNTTTEFSFIKEVIAEAGVTFIVCTDKACTNVVRSKTVDLEMGDNVFYVLAESGDDIKLYTVTIRRRPIHTITFNTDGGTAIKAQYIEEDCDLTEVDIPTKEGYTFSSWVVEGEDVSLPYTVTSNVTFYANYTAKEYVVTLDVAEGEKLAETKVKVTYNCEFILIVPTRKGYSFSGWYLDEVQFTDAEGKSLSVWNLIDNATVTAKWEINTYDISVNKNIDSAGEISKSISNVAFNSIVTIEAKSYLGYVFTGWYVEDTKLSVELIYTFKMPAEDLICTATWEVEEKLTYLTFSSDESTCNITGVKSKNITQVNLPDYVTSIEGGAFSGCSSLESLTLPFVGGSVKTASDKYQYPFGYIFGESGYTGGIKTTQYYYGDSLSLTTNSIYYIPETLKSVAITGGNILRGAFYECSSLTSITIPVSVSSIGQSAFSGCSGLDNIKIPDNVLSIEASAFRSCSSLTNIKIPDSVLSIDMSAFDGCSALKSITIGNGLKTIANYAFRNCSSLTNLIIPDNVTSIGEGAFYECTSLIGLTIGKGITTIDSEAFYKCTSLTSLTIIGNGVTTIDYEAFCNCTSLTSLTIGNGVTTIGIGAFRNCSSLTSLIIPDSVTYISEYAFKNCSTLENVLIGKNVTYIGHCLFEGCKKLNNVKLDNPNGWWGHDVPYPYSSDIAITGLEDPAVAAEYLTGIYCNYYWYLKR